jgi:hypothetical protein
MEYNYYLTYISPENGVSLEMATYLDDDALEFYSNSPHHKIRKYDSKPK